jgi:GNAT superfamily N-acetyltransferase
MVPMVEDTAGVSTRPATAEDAEGLAEASQRAWQAAYVGLMPQKFLDGLDRARRVESWRRRLREPDEGTGLLVATIGGTVAGFVMFGGARDVESGPDGELYAINVHPDHWRSGAGSALLSAAVLGLAGLGHREATLWVVTGNDRARRFYERRGWHPTEVTRTIELGGADVPEVRYDRSVP